MMAGWTAVYYREMLLFRGRLKRLVSSMAVSPLLYLIAFSYAMGDAVRVEGHSYTEFLLPGLAAMASMTQAFTIATEINVARFYHHVFEEILSAPVSRPAYVFGEVLAGVTRAVVAICVILLLGALFGVTLNYGIFFWLTLMLNAFVFASIAVACAMLVRSHADQSSLSSFVITPMAFLGGTFFPVERLPDWAGYIVSFLPLTHAAQAARASAFGQTPAWNSLILLAVIGMAAFLAALGCVNRARD